MTQKHFIHETNSKKTNKSHINGIIIKKKKKTTIAATV
jgi:hypothetical protein